ncbi:MAG: hypothetical protein JNM56_22485 [Planctomycetia bacterium]|nr:hypothetical protein [Planctomycetia bacterium]
MRFIARTVRGLYVQAAAGMAFYVPQDGTPGYPVSYLAIEARSQRERAAEYRADGNHLMARRLRKAAKALEALLSPALSAA